MVKIKEHHTEINWSKYNKQGEKKYGKDYELVSPFVKSKQITEKANLLFKQNSQKLNKQGLSSILSSNIQDKKKRQAVDAHLKSLGFQGESFRKYRGYNYSKDSKQFITAYAEKTGYKGRVFRPDGTTYDKFDDFLKNKSKVIQSTKFDKITFNYTVQDQNSDEREWTDHVSGTSLKKAIEN